MLRVVAERLRPRRPTPEDVDARSSSTDRPDARDRDSALLISLRISSRLIGERRSRSPRHRANGAHAACTQRVSMSEQGLLDCSNHCTSRLCSQQGRVHSCCRQTAERGWDCLRQNIPEPNPAQLLMPTSLHPGRVSLS